MNNGWLVQFSTFRAHLSVTVTQISSAGDVTSWWTGFTSCPFTRWNLNRLMRTDRNTSPSAIENRHAGHFRFPAKPNGWKARLGSCLMFSGLKRSGSNLKRELNSTKKCVSAVWMRWKVYLNFPKLVFRVMDLSLPLRFWPQIWILQDNPER